MQEVSWRFAWRTKREAFIQQWKSSICWWWWWLWHKDFSRASLACRFHPYDIVVKIYFKLIYSQYIFATLQPVCARPKCIKIDLDLLVADKWSLISVTLTCVGLSGVFRFLCVRVCVFCYVRVKRLSLWNESVMKVYMLLVTTDYLI